MADPYVRQLRRYLRKRGSPLAPYAGLMARTERRYGLPQGLLAGIAAAETSLATDPAAGSDITSGHNAWGWGPHITFPNWGAAIQTIGRGLGKNYIGQGLKTPLAIGQKYAPASAGNAPTHWASTVSSIMRDVGGGAIASGPFAATGPLTPPLQVRPPKPIKLNQKTRVPYATAYAIAASLAEARATGNPDKLNDAMKILYGWAAPQKPPSKTEADYLYGTPAKTGGGGKFTGKLGPVVRPLKTPMPGGSEFMVVDAEGAPGPGGQHYHGAKDWFAPAGTAVVSPVAGKIVEVRASRTRSGQVFGGTVKVQAPNGVVYVFRHVDPKKVRPGMRVRAGQLLATVTAWTDGSPHTHVEVWRTLSGGYALSNMIDPTTVFG